MEQIREAYFKRLSQELDEGREITPDIIESAEDFFGKYISEPQSSVTVDGVEVGWYQDGKGSLHHYDGVVWDSVPNGQIGELEFLGL
jgi:hypothetical protein